jgi:branched-chain amino acid transport system substrate-binding protein
MTLAERNHEYRYCRAPEVEPHLRCLRGDNLHVQPLLRNISCLCALGLLSLAACGGSTAARTIRIGVDLPLSGDEGRAGTPTLNGVRFFVHQHPIVGGFNIEINSRDDAVNGVHNAKLGAQNISAFVADQLVMGVIGPFNSSVARVAIPLANQARLAMISPSASNRCLTAEPFLPAGLSPSGVAISCKAASLPSPVDLRPTAPNTFFRLATTDDLQGAAAADYGYKNLHLLRVAVLSDHEAYGQALAYSFRARFTKVGGLVVLYQDFVPSNTLDLTTYLNQAKKEGAQAVYFGGVTANKGCAIRAQMAAVFGAGAAIPYLGGDGIADDPACVRDAGSNAVGIYATVPAVDPSQVPGSQAVITAFKSQYRNSWDYGAYTILGYDAATILYGALDRTITQAGGKLPRRQDVVANVALTGTGADRTFGFDPAGDTTHRVVSVFEATSADPAIPWHWAGAVDYSAKLPY